MRRTGQEAAERARWLATEDALRRLRQDLQFRGVGFSWERIPATRTSPPKLIGKLKGRESTPIGFQASSWAMTMISAIFPTAVIEAGGVLKDKLSWVAVLWLDAPEGEARRREGMHPELDPRPEDSDAPRCPHDGALCRGRPSPIEGAPPHLCAEEGRSCVREAEGTNLRRPHDGYPLDGHVYPARRSQ